MLEYQYEGMVTITGCSYDGPATVQQGERINFGVDVEVGNGDQTPAEFTVGVFVNGTEVGQSPGSLDATTQGTVTVRGAWAAPSSPGDFSVSAEILDQQSIAGDPQLSSIRVDPSTVEEGNPLTIETEVNPNGASTNVTVVYSVAGREVGTETSMIGSSQRGPGSTFTAQFPYDRLVSRGVAPRSGSIDTAVTARLSGTGSSQSVEAPVTLVAEGGSGGGGGDDGSGEPGRGGPGGGGGSEPDTPYITDLGPTSADISRPDDLTLVADIAHGGDNNTRTLQWFLDGESLGVSGATVGPGRDRNNDGTTTVQRTWSFDQLINAGAVPSVGSREVEVSASFVGDDREVSWGGTLTIRGDSGGGSIGFSPVAFR